MFISLFRALLCLHDGLLMGFLSAVNIQLWQLLVRAVRKKKMKLVDIDSVAYETFK